LQERGGRCTQILVNGETEQTHTLPSPPASNTRGKEVGSKNWARGSSQDSALRRAEQRTLTSAPQLNRKGKRPREAEDLTSPIEERPAEKRTRASEEIEGQKEIKSDPVKYWAENKTWPKQWFEKDPNMSKPLSKKRPRATSYTQSVRDGDNPRAYTPQYEEVLTKAGIIMNAHQRQVAASNDCQQLCDDFLNSEYDTPDHSPFNGDMFWTALDRVRSRNELRVRRDVTPLIMPSAELLYLHGCVDLEHLIEELDAEWSKCSSLAGPQPKPDFCVGLMSSAFTEKEILKLKSYTAPNRATLVTEHLYFPFLTCEVKCGEQALNRADRQNAHSGSIAVNALVQLYRASSRVEELNRKILAFSISHDHSMVKIYGHYALIKDEKTTFYRHPIRSFDFTERNGKERWTAFNFTRAVYDKFAPLHLERIRSALERLPDSSSKSLSSEFDVDSDDADSQEIATPPSSQEAAGFKKPSLPSVTMRQENAELRAQIDVLMKRQKEQQQQLERLMQESKEKMGGGRVS
jgi:hypothetical protein